MAEIVNLRQARKRRARAEKERAADANRRLHGLSRSQKDLAAQHREHEGRKLDGHRLDDSDD